MKKRKDRDFQFRIWDNSNKEFVISSNLDAYKNNGNFIIQQYTGTKDSNGNKIFEGDIVKDSWSENQPFGYSPDEWYDNDHVFTVVWESPCFVFPSYKGQCIEKFHREVISNIFSEKN